MYPSVLSSLHHLAAAAAAAAAAVPRPPAPPSLKRRKHAKRYSRRSYRLLCVPLTVGDSGRLRSLSTETLQHMRSFLKEWPQNPH